MVGSWWVRSRAYYETSVVVEEETTDTVFTGRTPSSSDWLHSFARCLQVQCLELYAFSLNREEKEHSPELCYNWTNLRPITVTKKGVICQELPTPTTEAEGLGWGRVHT